MSDKVDIARSLLIKNLPTTLQTEPENSFAEAIYELLEKTFCVDKEAVESIVRFQELDGDCEEFACKCVVTFGSRVLKHRAIAQKSKLEVPTQVESITEVPKGLVQPAELKDLKVQPEDLKGQDTPKHDDAVPKPEVPGVEPDTDTTALAEASVDATVCEQAQTVAESVAVQQAQIIGDNASKHIVESASSNEGVTLQQIDSVESDKDESEVGEDAAGEIGDVSLLSEGAITDDEGLSVLSVQESDEHITDKNDVTDPVVSKINLPSLNNADRHTQEHFMTLPIDWDGAPEFQWKYVSTPNDSCKFILQNVMHTDLLSPWLYPLVVRAQHVITDFNRPCGDEMVNDCIGSVQLIFPDDHTILTNTINYLVYLRTANRRRIKILLPQTPSMRINKEELTVRLGRKREPTLVMRQLAMKPLPEHVTEQHIRHSAFSNFPLDSVEFKQDAVKQRVAILTFSSAEMAIAAHSQNNYVRVGDAADKHTWVKVLYVDASLRSWKSPYDDHLLTRSEIKQLRGSNSKKKKAAQLSKIDANMGPKTSGADATTNQTKQPAAKTQPSPSAPNPFKRPSSGMAKAGPKQQSGQIAHAKKAQKRANPQMATSNGTFPKKAKHSANATRNKPSKKMAKAAMMRNAHSSNATRPMLGPNAFRGPGPQNVPGMFSRYGETSSFPSARSFPAPGIDTFGGLSRVGRDARAFGQTPAFAEKEHLMAGFNTPRRRDVDMALYDAARSRNGADAVPFGGIGVSAVPKPLALRGDPSLHRPMPRVAFTDDRRAEPGFFFGGAWR